MRRGAKLLKQQELEQRLLAVQPVAGGHPSAAAGVVEHGGVHFLAPVRRQAVQEECVFGSKIEQGLADLVGRKALPSFGLLILMANG